MVGIDWEKLEANLKAGEFSLAAPGEFAPEEYVDIIEISPNCIVFEVHQEFPDPHGGHQTARISIDKRTGAYRVKVLASWPIYDEEGVILEEGDPGYEKALRQAFKDSKWNFEEQVAGMLKRYKIITGAKEV